MDLAMNLLQRTRGPRARTREPFWFSIGWPRIYRSMTGLKRSTRMDYCNWGTRTQRPQLTSCKHEHHTKLFWWDHPLDRFLIRPESVFLLSDSWALDWLT